MSKVTYLECIMEEQFYKLKHIWEEETGGLSLMSRRMNHWAYQQLIQMGTRILPFILRDLKAGGNDWSTLLREITGVNPVPPEHIGKVQLIREDWINWLDMYIND